MLTLNPSEKIDSWEIIFTTKVDEKTAKNIPSHLRSRTLTASELGIGLSDGITQRIDEVVESVYSVTWKE